MKMNVENKSALERRLNIEIPNEVVKQTFQKTFLNIQKQAHIKGFRPGKAPIATIKAMYGSQAKQDVAQELIQAHYFKALKEHSLEPITYPEFEFDPPEEEGLFAFTAHFEVKPAVELKKYQGLVLTKEKFNMGPEKVNDILENIRASRAELVEEKDSRASKNGDVAVIDFDGFIDGGKPLDGGTGKDHHLELGSNQFIEGFEAGVVGMKVGDTKTLSLKFPDPYQAMELAGKPVEFKVTLKAIKTKKLPELNDDFVKTLGGFESLEKLKETIAEDVEKTEKKRIEGDLKNELFKKLAEQNPVEVPPSLLKEQKQMLIDDMKKKLMDQGMGEEDFAQYVDKWNADFETTARSIVQVSFIVEKIAEAHALKAKDEDVEAKLNEYAAQTGIEIGRIRDFYNQGDAMGRLTYSIMEEKVVQYLLAQSQINEIEPSKAK